MDGFDITECPDLLMEVAFEKTIPSMNTTSAAKMRFQRW